MDEGRTALAFTVVAMVVFAVGVGAYQRWSEQDWIVWTGIAISVVLALVGLTRSLRLVRAHVEPRGVPIVTVVLSTALVVFEIGLVVIVLALSYALRDLTF